MSSGHGSHAPEATLKASPGSQALDEEEELEEELEEEWEDEEEELHKDENIRFESRERFHKIKHQCQVES